MTRWSLAGKTALVTGVTAGIGLAIADELIDHSAIVIGVARTAERVERWAADRGMRGIAADVVSPEDRKRIFDGYKANRSAAPDDLEPQFNYCRSISEAIGVPCFELAEYEADASVQGRMQAWQVAFGIFRDHPLIGVGESAFLEAWSQYAPIDAGHRRYVAHNLFLEVLGQLGLVGLFGYLGFTLCALWSAWRARNGELGGEARAILAALIGYLVCQQFSGYSLSWFLYTLCAFATCCDAYGRKSAPRPADGGALDEAFAP